MNAINPPLPQAVFNDRDAAIRFYPEWQVISVLDVLDARPCPITVAPHTDTGPDLSLVFYVLPEDLEHL